MIVVLKAITKDVNQRVSKLTRIAFQNMTDIVDGRILSVESHRVVSMNKQNKRIFYEEYFYFLRQYQPFY